MAWPWRSPAQAVLDHRLNQVRRRAESAPPRARLDAGDFDGGTQSGGDGPRGNQLGYEGASMSRRLSPWRPNRAHINSILTTEGPMLRARTRQLVANSPYASNASETFVSYATGTGIVPASLIANPEQKAAVQRAFLDWTDEADADGLTDFYGLQSLCARALFDAGEVFVRLRPRLVSDGLSVPLQLQVLEAEQLDTAFTMEIAGGNMIRQGVEFDAIGRRVAYHFWRAHPGDYTVWSGQGERVRVPAENVLHIYKPLRPGQIRGRPWLTAAMVKLYDLDQYDDAELNRKKSAAMMMGFVTRGLNGDQASLVEGAAEPDAGGTSDLVVESNIIQILAAGEDVKFNTPADVGPNYEAFQIRNLYALCAAMGGLPYHAVTGDVSRANYSSLRASLVEIKRRIEQFQYETLIFQLCRPVWRAWLPTAVTAGTVALPGFVRDRANYLRVRWIPPKWEWVDPLKDVHAEKVAVDAGFQSRSEVIRGRGMDPEVVDAEIAADHAREEQLGISFPVGFSKSPDAPVAGSDLTASPGNDLTEGNQAPNPPADQQGQAAAADAMREAIVDALLAQPQPVVNVNVPAAPKRGVEVTKVTKHDADGRILEFEKSEVA